MESGDPSSPEALGQILNADPLSDETRKNRRSLLGLSTLGIAVTTMNLVPTRIAALGIELSNVDGKFQFLLLAVTIYFLFAFLLSLLPDYLRWFGHRAYVEYRTSDAALAGLEQVNDNGGHTGAGRGKLVSDLSQKLRRLRSLSKPLATARLVFDAVLPIVLAIVSIWLLACSIRPAAAY